MRLTEDGEWLWSVRAKGRQRMVVVEVEGIFEAKGKGYVGYVQMGRVPRRVAVEEVAGGGEDAEDLIYLRWVALGLRQLEEKKRASSRAEGMPAGGGGVYLVVVPRGTNSVVRLYTGSVSQRVLDEGQGKENRRGLLRRALRSRLSNPTQREEETLGGVSLSYEQIDLTEPRAATLFRGFFLTHGLLA